MSDAPAMATFDFPTSWSHGRGLASKTGPVVAQLGCRNPLVLTDQILVSLGVVQPVLDSLRQAGIEYTICDAVNYEPTVALFDSLVAELDSKRFDAVVAVGGGSVLDTAKGLAVIGSFGGPHPGLRRLRQGAGRAVDQDGDRAHHRRAPAARSPTAWCSSTRSATPSFSSSATRSVPPSP